MTTSLSSKKMSFIKTISNVNPEASIISLEVGSSEETDEELRRRVLFAIQNPPQGGAVVDYVNWVSTVPGVYRAFVRTASKENPGVVGFSFITKDLDQNEIIKDRILNKLSSLAPCGVKVEFVPLKFVNFPIKFSIVPAHLGTDAKIALKNFFKNHFTPKGLYGENLKRSDGSVYLSELAEVLGAIPGEERYLIEEPKTHIFADEGVFYVC